jgi:homoserine kinase
MQPDDSIALRSWVDLQGAEIEVPGSVANLGAGFDTLAVAVQLYVRLRIRRVEEQAKPPSFEFVGRALEGENRIARAFMEAARLYPADVPALTVEVRTEIPMRSGLGSSGAATVAGLSLYRLINPQLPLDGLLTIATAIEGHPDNAAASLYGGLVGSWMGDDGAVRAYSRAWPESLRLVIATPTVPVETAVARGRVPAQFPRADAVFNLQRVALLLHVLERRDYRLLREALRDRWHQPYRQDIVPGLQQALALDHPDLLGVCLSGSGPSVVAFAERNIPAIETLLRQMYQQLGFPCEVRTVAVHQALGSRR